MVVPKRAGYVSIREAARLCNHSYTYMWQLLQRNQIVGLKDQDHWYIAMDEIQRFLLQKAERQTPEYKKQRRKDHIRKWRRNRRNATDENGYLTNGIKLKREKDRLKARQFTPEQRARRRFCQRQRYRKLHPNNQIGD